MSEKRRVSSPAHLREAVVKNPFDKALFFWGGKRGNGGVGVPGIPMTFGWILIRLASGDTLGILQEIARSASWYEYFI